MSLVDVHRHIEAHRDDDLELLKKLVAQPSVSARNMGVRECTELLRSLLTELGCDTVAICPTDGQPIVFAERKSKKAGAKTILFYGHYDTQPPDPVEEWITPPFEPTVRDGRLYGLGAADNKGQFLAHLLAVRSWLATEDDVPVNVKFILDGEEESGSPNMRAFVETHKDMLMADLVYNSDGPMNAGDFPEIKLGFRGDLSMEFELTTATHQNHSKTGQLIPNPAIELCQLVASMIDRDGHVLIDGFYDDVLPPTAYERELMDGYAFEPKTLARVYGVKKLLKTAKEAYYTQLMFRPTFTINGMSSGYCGPGHKTCVPRSALMKLDVRLVKNMDPEKVLEKIRRHAAAFDPEIVVRAGKAMYPSKSDAEQPLCQAAIAAARSVYPNAVVHPSSGGSNPDYVWTGIMKMPSVTVPYGNADQTNHSPNENLRLDCFHKGIHVSAAVIGRIGEI
ncbi:M20/M25/M40 family metallo-hydrolase [Pyramidobacter piscolens]|uniref:M20/M25/M40 family metallo-hydrolase n=1 Tax=Pyramidobacter piscolens TaxID=638849 RepID=UPI001FCBBE8E|nr:M20/M25/M40 family metallo-hydrolase [Pyramidobacter piscolens]BDF77656.1 peptidase M20 [Pyramidobacter piscolens]